MSQLAAGIVSLPTLPRRPRLVPSGLFALVALACALAVAVSADLGSPSRVDREAAPTTSSPTTAPVSSEAKQRARDAYERLPLSFAPNTGQSDGRVRYLAQGAGYGLYFSNHKVTLSLSKQAGSDRGRELISSPKALEGPFAGGTESQRGVALELRFPGASPNARLEASGRREGTVNYLTKRH